MHLYLLSPAGSTVTICAWMSVDQNGVTDVTRAPDVLLEERGLLVCLSRTSGTQPVRHALPDSHNPPSDSDCLPYDWTRG